LLNKARFSAMSMKAAAEALNATHEFNIALYEGLVKDLKLK